MRERVGDNSEKDSRSSNYSALVQTRRGQSGDPESGGTMAGMTGALHQFQFNAAQRPELDSQNPTQQSK